MCTNDKNNGIMNISNGNCKQETIQKQLDDLNERLKDTEDKVNELESRIEYLESTPDDYDKWHDSQL